MIRSIFALTVMMSAGAANASCLPAAQPVKDYMTKHSAWHIVNMSDLSAEDGDLWRRSHGAACPGQAQADLKGDGQISYGLVLTTATSVRGLILLNSNGHYLPKVIFTYKGGADVVHAAEPAPAYEFDTRRRVDITHQSFVFEHLESSATHYYWQNGEIKSVTISD